MSYLDTLINQNYKDPSQRPAIVANVTPARTKQRGKSRKVIAAPHNPNIANTLKNVDELKAHALDCYLKDSGCTLQPAQATASLMMQELAARLKALPVAKYDADILDLVTVNASVTADIVQVLKEYARAVALLERENKELRSIASA